MNTTDLLVLGLLVLVANLTLSALFVPPRAQPSPTEPLVRLWKLLALAFAQIAAWSIVLDQGGAVQSLADGFLRTASCFALVSGVQGTPVFAAPWNYFAGLIALNGLLFVPVTLLPALFPAAVAAPFSREQPQETPAAPAPAPVAFVPDKMVAPAAPTEVPPAPPAEPVPTAANSVPPVPPPAAPAAAAGSAPVHVSAATSPLIPDGARRPAASSTPVVPVAPRATEPVDPEAEYAALMRPMGPTPPPIRFGNRPS
jgi:hypothetical protein